jgi:hypothetical protein
MSATFISYRRNDSAGHTGRLYDHLCKAIGENSVFRDIDTIKPGTDFVEAVREGIQRCSSLIVVIGNHWLTAEDDSGRRLDHPLDYVRLEIGSALKQGIQIIPVLVEGAKMPDPSDLPEEISPLARRQALQLSDDRWDYDVGRLISALEKSVEKSAPAESTDIDFSDKQVTAPPDKLSSTQNQTDQTSRSWVVITFALLFTLVSGLTIWIWTDKPQRANITHTSERGGIQEEQKATSESESITTNRTEKREERQIKLPISESIPLQKENEIERLLILADGNINRLQLTAPSNNNAVEKYRRILELHPGHTAALHGLEHVSRKYTGLAEQAAKANKLNKADNYLKLAKSIAPHIPEIGETERLIISIRQQQSETERRIEISQNKQEKTNFVTRDQVSSQPSCTNSCQKIAEECNQNLDTNSCSTEQIQLACEPIQRECLHDPQLMLTWGEFALSAECRGRYNECTDEKFVNCEERQKQQLNECASSLQNCLNTCQ